MTENKFFERFMENISKVDEFNLKHIVELMEKERSTFRYILDSLDEGLIVLENLQVIFINRRGKEMLNIRTLYLPVDIDVFANFGRNSELIAHIFALPCEDMQNEFSLKISVDKTIYYGIEKIIKPDSFQIIKISDITTAKELEFQLKNLESLGALNTLAAGIAHEIKNPMTAIDLHTQILKRAIERNIIDVPIEVANYVNIISEENNRLNKILDDFLISARKRALQLTFEDLVSYIEGVIDLLNPLFEKHKIKLNLKLNSVPKIFIDKDYLKQAFINLIKNAVEAMDNRRTRILTIKTFYEVSKDAVCITINDTGSGIGQEMMSRIFEPYYTTRENGTGLGLTIVYKIIKEHRGDIMVFSRIDKDSDSVNPAGTTFTISLPVSKGTKMLEK